MAIDEETFYNIIGEEVSRSALLQQMINFYSLKLQAGETKVTDFNEGSEIRNLLEAIAVDLYWIMEHDNNLSLITFIETAEGEWLDKHGANPFVNIVRDIGSEAEGYVTFSIPEVLTSDVVIEEGTIVLSEENGLEYVTDSEVYIMAGETSVDVSITCLTVGEDGNCDVGTVTVIDENYISVNGLSVTNAEAVAGGTDYEEDDEYRERLLNYVRKDDFGSIGYYNELGSSVDGVHDVLLVDETVSPDEQSTYTKIVLVNGDVKPTPDSVLSDVLEVFTDVENKVISHNFTVARPEYVEVSLDVNLTVSEAIETSDIENLLHDVFNGGSSLDIYGFDGLYIGESITRNKLYSALEMFDVVEDIFITEQGESTEISEISVNENEVLKLASVNITQNTTT